MKVLENISALIETYNAYDWTTTDIDRLLKGQKKLSHQKYLLGVELGNAKASATRSELRYKSILTDVEIELSDEMSNNQASIVARRNERVKEAKANDSECKAIAAKLAAIFNSIDSTLMSMSQTIKYLENEKRYNSRLEEIGQ